MAVTQAQVDALNEAIAGAERQITNGSESVTYRSIADLKAARDDLQMQLNAQGVADGTATPQPRNTYVSYGGRGYNSGCR